MVTTGMPATRKSSSATKALELPEAVASAGTADASPDDPAAGSHVAVGTANRPMAVLVAPDGLARDLTAVSDADERG